MSKRERPSHFFDDEEDEDYLIEASLENDKENDVVGFDEYMNQRPISKPQPSKSLDFVFVKKKTKVKLCVVANDLIMDDNDPFDDNDLFNLPELGGEELFTSATTTKPDTSLQPC
jgi:hypothetical protein